MTDAEKIVPPPAGRRVLVTRAAHQAGKLSEGLRALGFEPVEVAVIEIQPPQDFAPLDHALRSLADYDWLVLTSANTVHALADRAASLGLNLAAEPHLKVAAVGEATATAARDAGLAVALVPKSYIAESLVAEVLNAAGPGSAEVLKGHGLVGRGFIPGIRDPKDSGALAPEGNLDGQRFLIARAAVTRDVIPDALRAAGATVDVIDAYRNVMPQAAPALLRQALQKGIIAAAFTSSSTVTHLADAARHAGIAFPFVGVAAISIGPITSQTLRDLGWETAAEATQSDVPGLIQAVARALG